MNTGLEARLGTEGGHGKPGWLLMQRVRGEGGHLHLRQGTPSSSQNGCCQQGWNLKPCSLSWVDITSKAFPTCSVIQSAPPLCPHLPAFNQHVPRKSWDESSWVCLWNSNLAFHSCVRSVPRGWHMFDLWPFRTCPVQYLSGVYSSFICICSPFSDWGVAVPAASNTAPSQATHSCGGVRRTHGLLPPPASMGPWVSQRKDQ